MWMWLLQVVCMVYPLTVVNQCVAVAVGADVGVVSIQCVGAVGAGVGVVSILVLWTIRLHDADDSVISVQIVDLEYA